jgi:hypothetical protein
MFKSSRFNVQDRHLVVPAVPLALLVPNVPEVPIVPIVNPS